MSSPYTLFNSGLVHIGTPFTLGPPPFCLFYTHILGPPITLGPKLINKHHDSRTHLWAPFTSRCLPTSPLTPQVPLTIGCNPFGAPCTPLSFWAPSIWAPSSRSPFWTLFNPGPVHFGTPFTLGPLPPASHPLSSLSPPHPSVYLRWGPLHIQAQ